VLGHILSAPLKAPSITLFDAENGSKTERKKSMKKRTGGCACSAIRYEVTGEPFLLQNGHCKSCQRLTGTAFRMGSNWSEEPVRVVSGDMTTYSRKADSGRTFETKFCKVCGTTVFTFAESQPERV